MAFPALRRGAVCSVLFVVLGCGSIRDAPRAGTGGAGASPGTGGMPAAGASDAGGGSNAGGGVTDPTGSGSLEQPALESAITDAIAPTIRARAP